MANKLFFLIVIYSFIYKVGYNQVLGHADSLSREKADSIVKNRLKGLVTNNYLLFSIADRWYLVIVPKNKLFYEYYINSDTPKYGAKTIQTIRVVKNGSILLKAFNEKSYRREFTTFNSPFYNGNYVQSDGNITYFYLAKGGTKYGESRLSVIIKPNPINQKVYYYLLTRLIKFISYSP